MCYSFYCTKSWLEVLGTCCELLCFSLTTAISIATSGIAVALAVYCACISYVETSYWKRKGSFACAMSS